MTHKQKPVAVLERSIADYLKLLEHSFEAESITNSGCAPGSRLDFLGNHIFDFTTYDDDMSALFAAKALEVCCAISNGKTFDYIKDQANYVWYLLLVNTPFFAQRINWGCSIRGAFWDYGDELYVLQSCAIHVDWRQVHPFPLNRAEWLKFIEAMVIFTAAECAAMGAQDQPPETAVVLLPMPSPSGEQNG